MVLHVGLLVGFLGSVALTIGLAFPMLGIASASPGAPPVTLPGLAQVLIGVGGLAVLVSWVVSLIGQCLCCAAPAEAGARGWAASAVAFGVLSGLLIVLAVLLAMFSAQGRTEAVAKADDFPAGQPQEAIPRRPLPPQLLWLMVCGGVAALAEVVCLGLFVRALARFLGERRLAQRAGECARFFVTFTLVVAALNYFSGDLLAALPGEMETKVRMIPLLLVVELVCFLILYAQLLGLVKETRDMVVRGRAAGNGAVEHRPQPTR
jgi:hypothetical protein